MFKRNLIKDKMYYDTDKERKKIFVSSNKEVVDYAVQKSAYNPLYPDAGKIVKLPENYLYRNKRHHLKDFAIIDGKEDGNGNQVIIGFLGTSKINKKTRQLTSSNRENELIAIEKVVIDKDRYNRLIKKSRSSLSNRELSELQLSEVKDQAKKPANIRKSKYFRA